MLAASCHFTLVGASCWTVTMGPIIISYYYFPRENAVLKPSSVAFCQMCPGPGTKKESQSLCARAVVVEGAWGQSKQARNPKIADFR